MEINLSGNIKQVISIIILLILPLITLLIGLMANILNAWFYVGLITWFGMGVIFYGALN